MIEYWLQKKTLGGWSHVTWYEGLELAERIFNECSKKNTGYSWRLVKAETIHEHLLDDSIPLQPSTDKLEAARGNVWAGNIKTHIPDNPKPADNGWTAAPKPLYDDTHGMVGKVWMINHAAKSRARIEPKELEYYLSQGWEKGGPKTAFRE